MGFRMTDHHGGQGRVHFQGEAAPLTMGCCEDRARTTPGGPAGCSQALLLLQHTEYQASLHLIWIPDSSPATEEKLPSWVLVSEKFKAKFGFISRSYM